MTKQEFIDRYLDRYEQEHPNERITQEILDKADCAYCDQQIDQGKRTEHDLTPEQEKIAKEMRKGAKAVNAYGKEVKRERKPDKEKREIVRILAETLTAHGYSANVANVERTIDFNGYTITLTKHRPPKKN